MSPSDAPAGEVPTPSAGHLRRFLKWHGSLGYSSRLVPLALLGFVYATAVIWYGHLWFNLGFVSIDTDAATRSHAYLTRGKSVLWFLLVAVESGVWFAVAASYASPEPEDPVKNTREWVERWLPRLFGYSLIVLSLLLPLLYSNLFATAAISDVSPLLWHGQKMLWLAVPAITAVVCVIARLRDAEHAASQIAKGDLPARAAAYMDRQQRLRFALGVLGLMLSLNVLTTGALRVSLAAELSTTNVKAVPDMELVLAFGGAYTFLVIAFYAPVYFALTRAGSSIAETAATQTQTTVTNAEELLKWLEARAKWEKVLGLDQDWLKSLQAGLVLLSPFFAALASLLLPSK